MYVNAAQTDRIRQVKQVDQVGKVGKLFQGTCTEHWIVALFSALQIGPLRLGCSFPTADKVR